MLKNVLIVVDDIEKSIEFYRDLFGLQVILKNEGNVILSEGLVLQDADIWGKTLNETSTPFNNMMELYFEEVFRPICHRIDRTCRWAEACKTV